MIDYQRTHILDLVLLRLLDEIQAVKAMMIDPHRMALVRVNSAA